MVIFKKALSLSFIILIGGFSGNLSAAQQIIDGEYVILLGDHNDWKFTTDVYQPEDGKRLAVFENINRNNFIDVIPNSKLNVKKSEEYADWHLSINGETRSSVIDHGIFNTRAGTPFLVLTLIGTGFLETNAYIIENGYQLRLILHSNKKNFERDFEGYKQIISKIDICKIVK